MAWVLWAVAALWLGLGKAPPPKYCHNPHVALQLWGPLIIVFWRSERLLQERPIPVPLRQPGHQALHYFPLARQVLACPVGTTD